MNKEYKENMNPKECSICHKVKPQGEFYKAGGIHQSACKECKKTRYKENVENIKKMQQEIERLNNIIETANKILSNILVINNKEHEGKYRPIKNTSKNDVYKSVCMLYGILGTPYRCDYDSLQEFKRADVMNEETINGIIRYNKRAAEEIKRLQKELDKTRLSELNKEYIINEFEKHLEKEISRGRSKDNIWLMGCYDEDREILDKLHELKGDSSNE